MEPTARLRERAAAQSEALGRQTGPRWIVYSLCVVVILQFLARRHTGAAKVDRGRPGSVGHSAA